MSQRTPQSISKLTPQLPVWLQSSDVNSLAKVIEIFWRDIENYLYWWLTQQHSEDSDIQILDLLAWERGITRLANESIEIYGKRVIYAFANAKDAGSPAGMKAIFWRLGFDIIDINERVEGFDWDQIEILMLESQFAEREELINAIIASYGRTCSRYFLSAVAAVNTDERFALIEFEKEVIG
ncbi:phage tail protein [Shewanella surugensis]|uniref:Phage tail protein n=1 Tax=Shewanella surugensis TaxID=212020 RepID=A0ABT0L6J4_9GAMM|nr:phage tail protein [Shewanella surugensis]MCL1123298.1 phage tail protein [Shewanella surugensis]